MGGELRLMRGGRGRGRSCRLSGRGGRLVGWRREWEGGTDCFGALFYELGLRDEE